jgi:predicted ArsR family transcriptional regulator
MSVTEERKAIAATDAANQLGVTYDNVRRHYNKGNLEGFWVETVLWIYLDSLKEFKRTRKPRGRQPGFVLETQPKNRATKRKKSYGGRVKSKEEILQDGLKEREKQRKWARDYRQRQKQKKAQQEKTTR